MDAIYFIPSFLTIFMAIGIFFSPEECHKGDDQYIERTVGDWHEWPR